VAVFAAGFLAGVVFSAWKLDSSVKPLPATPAKTPQADKRTELQKRIAGIEKMLAKNPDNSAALVQLGNDYFDVGNFKKAIAAYNKALKLDPGNADVMTDMGIAFRRNGEPKEALASFRKALEANPNHTTALFNLGIVLRDDAKDYKGALEAWETFLEKAKDSPFAVMVRPWVKQLREKTSSEPHDKGTEK
jgi:cytochrome c-type biogenesis protein CcmH/NrfG